MFYLKTTIIAPFLNLVFLSLTQAQFLTDCQKSIAKHARDTECPAINLSAATTTKKYYMSLTFKMNWFKAHQYCQLHGMNLATIYNKEEQDQLQQFLDRIGWAWDMVWIGANDFGDDGQYWYIHSGSPVNFTDWLSGTPLKNDEHCVHLWRRAGEFGWKDGNCNVPLHFACDIAQ